MNEIILYRGASCWLARFKGPHAERIRRTFKTDTVPTPFLPAVPGEVVRVAIQERNPGARVSVPYPV